MHYFVMPMLAVVCKVFIQQFGVETLINFNEST